MSFKRWKDVPEVQDAVTKLADSAQKYSALLAENTTDSKSQAQKLWSAMSASYWDVLLALVDAQTKSMPATLTFDPEERLFIDLGCLPGVLNLNSKFDPKAWLTTKCAGDIFPVMTFSDYIAESWAAVTGNEAPVPVIGMSLNDRINTLNEELFTAQGERDAFIDSLAAKYPTNLNLKQSLQIMDEFLISAMKVNMRVPEYREGDEATRQKLAQQRKAYNDAEKGIQLFVSSAQKNEANPLPIPQVEKFTAMHEKTKILAKEILYSQIDAVKIARRTKKITDTCSGMTDQMKRAELRAMITKKREYLTVPAKNARCDTSLLCQPDSMPIDYAKDFGIVREFTAMDVEMFNVPRVRMYGIPRVIFVPGQGLGTYDWSDHTIIIPAFPVGGNDKSVSYALGTFRWDSDEDRKLKTPYEQQIKENRKKSLLALASSFYKDYSLWLTKEKRGYRILPRETHKVFTLMFTVKAED
ncbi:MAG: hypothetical protein IJG65_03535 [Synergistaceae bacterium]|nr:hypothetical protein [Synergistaceae bacterium]